MQILWQSLLLTLSFLIVFIWQNSSLSAYSIPAIGFLVLFFVLFSFLRKKRNFNPFDAFSNDVKWSVFIANIVILLFIFLTGGLNSPIFFLLYFLVFGVSFVLEPFNVLIFAVGILLVFLNLALKDDVTGNFIKLGALFLISPIAFFFGKEYRQEEEEQDKILEMKDVAKDTAETIEKNAKEIINQGEESLKPEQAEKIKEIVSEAETLKEEAEKA